VLTDPTVVAMALAAVVGARVGGGPGVWVGAALGTTGLLARRSALLVLAVALAAAGLGDRALAGLDPAGVDRLEGWVVLVDDPVRLDGGGVRVVVATGGRRLEAVAYGAAAARLEPRLAGERVQLDGSTSPLGPGRDWLVVRRVVSRLAVDEVRSWEAGTNVSRVANGLRRTLERGAAHLPDRTRSLLLGVVLGDDRAQPAEVADDFRASGLTHLQAVSGQNVAFVLVLLGPLLSRLRWSLRLPVTLAAVAFFCLLVRFEPSVVRAAAMTGVAATASALGRPTAGIRVLGLAVTGLVLVDPLLARSVGFGLSASASAGILLLGPRLRAVLPGPATVRELLAVTLAAQAGALPLLLATFGSVPVATVPANLLAVPAAGPLMVWGLGAGLVAGAGAAHGLGWVAVALHGPTAALAWWLSSVAAWGAGLHLGSIDAPVVSVVAAVAGLGWLARCGRSSAWLAVAVAVVLAVSRAPAAPRDGLAPVADGLELFVAGGDQVLVVDGPPGVARSLEVLRGRGVRCVDALVVAGGGRAAARLAEALDRRCAGLSVLAPRGGAHPGWRALAPGDEVRVGALVVVAQDGAVAVRRLLESGTRAAPSPPPPVPSPGPTAHRARGRPPPSPAGRPPGRRCRPPPVGDLRRGP
jgi:competence protein ComEC